MLNGNTYSDSEFGHHYAANRSGMIPDKDREEVFARLKERMDRQIPACRNIRPDVYALPRACQLKTQKEDGEIFKFSPPSFAVFRKKRQVQAFAPGLILRQAGIHTGILQKALKAFYGAAGACGSCMRPVLGAFTLKSPQALRLF